MTVKLLAEHHLEFLSLTGGFRGSSESIYMSKMQQCRGSNVNDNDKKTTGIIDVAR